MESDKVIAKREGGTTEASALVPTPLPAFPGPALLQLSEALDGAVIALATRVGTHEATAATLRRLIARARRADHPA